MTNLENFRTFKREAIAVKTDSDLMSALKKTLADAYVLYHTIHGFHWNLKGNDFWEYHKFFDEIVNDIYDHIDPIAENIVKLGGEAPFVMTELVKDANIKETRKFQNMNSQMVEELKNTFKVANSANEQGVANFIAERIDQHQKWDWFLKASLGE